MKLLRTVLQVVLPLLVLALGLVSMRALSAMRPSVVPVQAEVAPPLVDVVVVRTEDQRPWTETQGTVVPRTETRLVAEVAGRILEVSPALVNGGFVDAGEVLVRIDPTDLRLAVAQAEQEVARAHRTLAQEEADARVARRNWEAREGEAATPLVLHEPQVAEARAELAAAEAMLEKARRDVDRCEIRAPYDARVREEHVDAGQFVNRGEELARIYAVDWAEVRLPLPDADLAHLDLPLDYRGDEGGETGPEVVLRARFAGAEHEWHGRIFRTEGELDPTNRMVVAVARVEDPYGRGEVRDRPPLTVGMFVTARIEGVVLKDAVRLPRLALHGGNRVYVADDEDRLRFRDVQVAYLGDREAVVTSGLAPGDRVVVSPVELAVDGMQVRVEEPR